MIDMQRSQLRSGEIKHKHKHKHKVLDMEKNKSEDILIIKWSGGKSN